MLYNAIPVLMYHHVAPTDRAVNVYPDLFEDQLRAISTKGWKTLSGEEFLYFIQNENERPRKCCLLTFDDGFADNYVFAYPLLKKFGMKAMIFVATDFIEDGDMKRESFVPLPHDAAWELACTSRRAEVMCTWRELKEMEESGVFDIQSHGMSHKTPAMVRNKQYDRIKEDLKGGKAVLEKRLSKEVLHFAWPKGSFDEEGIRIAKEAGYKAIYTTNRGANRLQDLDHIYRLPVKKDGRWLAGKLPVYSSALLSRVYLKLRAGT